MAQARPFREVFADPAASIDRELASRGSARGSTESGRYDPAGTRVVERFKAQCGNEWPGKMTDALRKVAGS